MREPLAHLLLEPPLRLPGESADDYAAVVDQLPALVHLQPPGGAHRIQLERFSPHFDDPGLGFGKRAPAEMYQHVYDLPESELTDLVYLFDTEDAGLGGEAEARLKQAVERWLLGHPSSTLTFEEDGDALFVHDRRRGWPSRTHRFTGWQADALRLLESGRNAAALHRLLTGNGHPLTPGQVAEWLRRALELGLLFRDGRTYVSLPTWRVPVRMDEPGQVYGSFYHRRGPGFVIVMDRRDKEASARYTFDDPDLLATFDALQEPTPLDELTGVQQEAASLLACEGLALLADGRAVALPPRIQHWPVPCTGI